MTETENALEAPSRSGRRSRKTKVEVLRAYLIKEHPQTAAIILSKIEFGGGGQDVARSRRSYRNELLFRMLGIKKVADDAVRVVEASPRRGAALPRRRSGSHAGIADILNRLDKTQSEDVLKSLAADPARRRQGAQEHALHLRGPGRPAAQARTGLLDQVPIERLVLALKGTDAVFQAAILSSLASRSRRMVEAELQGGGDGVRPRGGGGAPRDRRHRASR